MARPVESKRVTAPACGRPAASPASTAPRSVTSVARDDALLDRRRQLAAVAGLRPLVAEQRAGDDRRDRRLRLARAVGAEHVEVQARAQVADVDDRLGARRHAADDVAGQRGARGRRPPSRARRPAPARPRRADRCTRPARSPRRPGSAPSTRRAARSPRCPAVFASSRASAREATAATAPVRSAVTERASSSATRRARRRRR